MELAGLSLTQVLTVFGGFGAAVFVLYLLKLRRRQVEVPFVLLWQEVLAEKQTTRLFSMLKRLLSLLIALAIVLALAMALGDPRFAGARDEGSTRVVLIDASASMQATDVQPSRLARARETVERMIDSVGGDDRMLIAQMDATSVPLTPLTDDPRALRDGLARLEETDVAADLSRGLRFALDVLRDQPHPEIVVVSDGVLGAAGEVEARAREAGVDLRFARVGRGGRNVAITAFAVRRYPLDKSRSEVLVELFNPGEREETVELTLLGDGQEIDVQRLRVDGGERLRRFFENVSGADRTLEARLRLADGTHDDQPADDRAYARLPERRRARVQAVSDGNLYLQAALLLDEYLEVVEVAPAAYPAAGRFDVTIFDGWVPPAPPETDAIYLYPVPREGGAAPFEVTGTVRRPFFERVEREHPIVRWTALRDVNIAESLQVRLQEGDHVVGGTGADPLLVTGRRADRRFVALLFDVRRSDLPLRVAWPLLLLSSVDSFVEEDARYLSSYRTGEPWSVPVPAGHDHATLVAPGGREREVPIVDGRALATGLRAGFYALRTGEQQDVFAANLGPSDESTMQPADRLSIGGRDAPAPEVRAAVVRADLWAYLVLGVLVALALEWLTYHRRYTV